MRPRIESLASELSAYFESFAVTLNNTNSSTYTFTEAFPVAPKVTLTSVDVFDNSQMNVNVYIENVTATSVTLTTSANVSGSIHCHALHVV